MKSLLVQCALAAVAAAAVTASVSMAQDSRPGLGAQIDALGLDRAALKSQLEGLSREERVAYLRSLGLRLPEGVARPEAALATGVAAQAMPVDRKAAATLTPGGTFTILPWTGGVDGTPGTVILPVRPGSVSSDGTVVIDPPAVGSGAGFTAPGAPAKP